MQVRGIVISVEFDVQVAKNGGGTYPGARLSYRDEAGALKEKAFHNNVFKYNAVLKTQLSNLNNGQTFVMEMEKEGEFWNVKSILPSTAVASIEVHNSAASANVGAKAPYTASPKSTYETPEERAKKQIYIVRQSSINSAIALAATSKVVSSVGSIIEVAKQFEAHVFGEDFDDGTIYGMSNDTDGIV